MLVVLDPSENRTGGQALVARNPWGEEMWVLDAIQNCRVEDWCISQDGTHLAIVWSQTDGGD